MLRPVMARVIDGSGGGGGGSMFNDLTSEAGDKRSNRIAKRS